MEKKKINVISIPPEAQANLLIGGAFYQRLNKFLMDFTSTVESEELISTMVKIQRNKTQDDSFAYNLETLIILLRDTEEAFKKAGHTVDNEVEIEVFSKDKGKG